MFLTTSLTWLSIQCILGTLAAPQIVINSGLLDVSPGVVIASFVPVSVIPSDLPPQPVITSTPAPVINQRSVDVPVETVGAPVVVGSSAPISLPPGVVAGPAVMSSVPAATPATLVSRTPIVSPPSAISPAPAVPQSLEMPQAAILTAPGLLPSANDPPPIAPVASNPPPVVAPASTFSAPVPAPVASNPPPVVAPASTFSAPVPAPVASNPPAALSSIPAASSQPVALPPPTAPSSSAMEGVLPVSKMTIPVGTHQAPGYQDYLVKVLGAVPSDIRNQAPNPSITVALPLISTFPAAKSAIPISGRRKQITYTTPGTNVSIIATLASPQDAPAIDPTTYEYTIGSMRYYIAAKLNATGDLPLNSSQDPFFWDIGYGAWCEFNSNPSAGPEGPNHLTYSVIVAALDGIKVGLLQEGWFELAFVEIMDANRGIVGMATVAPNQAPYGSRNVENVDEALKAMGSVVQVTPVYGGEAH